MKSRKLAPSVLPVRKWIRDPPPEHVSTGEAPVSFRKILVPLAGIDGDTTAIDAALLIGHEFHAHVEALCSVATADNPPTNQVAHNNSVDVSIEQADKIKKDRVRALFVSRLGSYETHKTGGIGTKPLSSSYQELHGAEPDLIAEHGRLSDLIIFSQAETIDHSWPSISIQAALRETTRPVLLVQAGVRSVGMCSAIAWNGSLEATRAVTLALPLLQRSKSTLVVTVGNYDFAPSGDKLVEYLRWHGIEATSMVTPVDSSSESATLLAACCDAGADLIILGAYTRYRTGRPTFGSMTFEMLTQNRISIFMAQ
ncbi:MAG: universal stress protein [Hyphomicrobiales bacterium]|nr:universal stress protein [Hyphomicrobiales bacterium]